MKSARERFLLALAMERDDWTPSSCESREQAMARAKAVSTGGAYKQSALLGVLGVERRLIGSTAAWEAMLYLARDIQQRFASWDAYANAWLDELDAISDDRANASLTWWLHDPASPWQRVAWNTDLADPPPILRTTCARCGHVRIRAWATAYVYCDYCAALVDYDAELVRTAKAGPVFEALVAELAPVIASALADHDIDGMTIAQRRLFDAWLETCPQAVSVRIDRPDYRARFVDYLAEAETVAAFDAEATRLRGEMEQAMRRLSITGDRVATEPFWMLVDAATAHAERRDRLARDHGIYAMHPDGASRELQQRIGWSMFAQAWSQFLDDGEREAMLARLGLVPQPPMVAAPQPCTWMTCGTCAETIPAFRGATKMICDRCGDRLDVESRTACPGCGYLVARGDDSGLCPICR